MRSRPLLATALGAVLALLMSSTAGAETAIGGLTVQRVPTGLRVTGTPAYSGLHAVAAEDAAADSTIDMAGADLRGATVGLSPDARSVVFTFLVGDMLPDPVNSAPGLIFTWDLVVDGKPGFFLQAGRVGTASALTPPSGEPAFGVFENGEDGFSEVGAVTGELGGGVVRWIVPLSMVGAKSNSTIGQGRDVPTGSAIGVPGYVYFNDNLGGDAITLDAVTLPGTVQLGIAPGGTPADQVATTTTAALKSGKIDSVLPAPAPGDYIVVARTCSAADDCTLASTDVTVS